jgi:toxin ParE1/3/4
LTEGVARIELAPEVFDDFDRFFDHIAELGSDADGRQRITDTIYALDILARSPLIGRKVKGGKRELLIGRSSRGYLALYRFLPDIDTVFVLALRSQRESDYKRGT